MAERVFLLSPASCSGRRAEILLRQQADFDLARRLRGAGVTLAEVFTFLSGLYFRGKMAYASAFGSSTRKDAVLIITAGRGLQSPHFVVRKDDLKAFAEVPISLDEPRYRQPLERDLERLTLRARNAEVVLLGSVAMPKYRELLVSVFGSRAVFPREFIGRGDMSRGGLMLRAADSGNELDYIPLTSPNLKGTRPPRLSPRDATN